MRKTLLFLGLIAGVGLLAYSNSFHVPFQFDDFANISENPVVHRLGNFLFSLKGYSYNPRRFIGYLTLALNYRFGGLDVFGYHLVNLCIHIITAMLVYFFVILTFRTPYFKDRYEAIGYRHEAKGENNSTTQRLNNSTALATEAAEVTEKEESYQPSAIGGQLVGNDDSRFTPRTSLFPDAHYSLFTIHYSRSSELIALFSALLFVSHPLQTEAVTYIVQRFASLTAMFYLMAIVMYVKARLASIQADKPASYQAIKLTSLQATEVTGNKESYQPSAISGQLAENDDSRFTIHGSRSSSSVASHLSPLTSRLLPFAFFALSFFSAVCAMKTKENSFTLPIVLVLYEFMFFKSSLRKKLAFLVPLLLTIIIIPVSVVGVHKPLGEIISDLSEKTKLQTNIPRWDYLMTQMRVITTYIRLLFFPVNQNLDYDYPVSHSLLEPRIFVSFLFLAAIFGAGVYLLYRSRQACKLTSLSAGKPASLQATEGEKTHSAKSKEQTAGKNPMPYALCPMPFQDSRSLSPQTYYRLIAFGIFWFFITLSVESSFIPIVDVIFEHRMYLPSIGAFIAITTAVFVILQGLAGNRETGMAVGGQGPEADGRRPAISNSRFTVFIVFFSLVVVALSALTIARNAVWQDGVSLWKDVLAKSPRNARAYNNLGYIYLERGQTDRALEYFLAAVSLRPQYADARDNVAVVYYEKGMFQAAVMQFRAALAFQPGSADIHHNLGLAYVQMGLNDDALAEFEAAVKSAPGNYEIYNDMGVVYRAKGLTEMAIKSFEKAIALMPDYAGAHYNLGLAYQSMGEVEKSEEHLNKAHLLDPRKF